MIIIKEEQEESGVIFQNAQLHSFFVLFKLRFRCIEIMDLKMTPGVIEQGKNKDRCKPKEGQDLRDDVKMKFYTEHIHEHN